MILGNNSDKIQKLGAAGSQSSELAIPHLACTMSVLLPSPSALLGWKVGYHGAQRTRLDVWKDLGEIVDLRVESWFGVGERAWED